MATKDITDKQMNDIMCFKGPFHRQLKPYVGEKLLYGIEGSNDPGIYKYIEYGYKGKVKKFYIEENALLFAYFPFGLSGYEVFIMDIWDSY